MKRTKQLFWCIFLIVMVAVGVAVVMNRDWILDWWKGLSYEPSVEMAGIRDSLALTDRGEFLFKASVPKLSEREEFNANCREVLDEEMSVLGCYTEGNIYVYNIVAEELSGIRELTTAHELLHAVWARMSEGERNELADELAEVLKQNQDILKSEIDNYEMSERQEELFVRAGTEVADLPAELEKVYAEIFRNQDGVVAFYNKYIVVFREMEREMEALKVEMEGIQTQIDELTAEYERRAVQLNAAVERFNACAERVGCFSSEGEFYAQRNVLVAEQEALDGLYEKINGLVNEYNVRVEKYNADATQTEKLNRVINSASEVE